MVGARRLTSPSPTLFDVWCDFKKIRKVKRKTVIDYEKRLTKVTEWLDMPISELS